jgi:DNA repair exonuclease SbcCD ATPase subunit
VVEMTEQLSSEQLARLKKRCDAATPAPWKLCHPKVDEIVTAEGWRVIGWSGFDSSDVTKTQQRSNARLICDFRNAAPALLAAAQSADALRQRCEALEQGHVEVYEVNKVLRVRCGALEQRQESRELIVAVKGIEGLRCALTAATVRAEKAEQLLHALTPMGSEFYGRPEKCADWIRNEISGNIKRAVDTTIRAKQAETERATLAATVETLREALDACASDLRNIFEVADCVALERAYEVLENLPDAARAYAERVGKAQTQRDNLRDALTRIIEDANCPVCKQAMPCVKDRCAIYRLDRLLENLRMEIELPALRGEGEGA